jgi:hypothetical protein
VGVSFYSAGRCFFHDGTRQHSPCTSANEGHFFHSQMISTFVMEKFNGLLMTGSGRGERIENFRLIKDKWCALVEMTSANCPNLKGSSFRLSDINTSSPENKGI